MKKFLSVILAGIMVLSVAACSSTATTEETEEGGEERGLPQERPSYLHQRHTKCRGLHREEHPCRQRLLLPDGVRPAARSGPRRAERLQSPPEAGGDQSIPGLYQHQADGSLDEVHHRCEVHDVGVEEEGQREGKEPPAARGGAEL